MGRILRLYVIREIALPTLLALLTITFILLIGIVYEFINLLLQPGISVWSVFHMLLLLMPSYISFALPMAILMGCLIGIGRMTLDREVLAMRASGVNLFSIFAPTLVIALFVSLGIMWFSGNLVPRWMGRGFAEAAELQFQLIQSLEPGRFHEKLGVGDESDMALYFRERDEPTRDMKGVVIKLEEDYETPLARDIRLHRPHKAPAGSNVVTPQMRAQVEAAVQAAKLEKEAHTSATLLAATKSTTATAAVAALTSASVPSAEDLLGGRTNVITMISAERGQIRAAVGDDATGDKQAASVVLTLLNGMISRHIPDPEKSYNIMIPFKRMEKRIYTATAIKKPFKTQTNAELKPQIQNVARQQSEWDAAAKDPTSKAAKKRDKRPRNQPKRELVERYALSLAFFVFALLAIPLAIWIKPSGKSWGILLAVAMMLIYYVFMKVGGSMVEIGNPVGVFVAFCPNLLFTLLGAALWRHNLKS